MIYYFERFSVNSPRMAERQQVTASVPEEAVSQLREKYGDDLQIVYDENFDVQYAPVA